MDAAVITTLPKDLHHVKGNGVLAMMYWSAPNGGENLDADNVVFAEVDEDYLGSTIIGHILGVVKSLTGNS